MYKLWLCFLVLISTFNLYSTEKKKVLIGVPICQKPAILKEFLDSLKHLNQNKISIDYFFIDDNKLQESSDLLQNFISEVSATNYLSDKFISEISAKCRVVKNRVTSGDYFCNETTHCWNEDLVWKVANFKNLIIKKTIEDNYDYLFLIDSDILLNPNTIEHLVSKKKDIISEIFWTRWNSVESEPLPQVWLYDTYTQYEIGIYESIPNEEIYTRHNNFLNDMKKPGVYEVGGLGACTLLSKKALIAGVNFKRVKNITFWGEDRHFCVRAAALGVKLFVDTHYPAYHIYRESDLMGTEKFKKENNYYPGEIAQTEDVKKQKLTLSMCVHNEAKNKCFKEMLEDVKNYIDEAVIIDDASTDDTMQICKDILGDKLHSVHNKESKFSNEVELRKQQWNECVNTNPNWILFLDADQIPEKKFGQEVKNLMNKQNVFAYYFRLYDFWDEEHYRDDQYWSAHNTYRPFLVKYKKDVNYLWRETRQHCGSMPYNVSEFPAERSDLRIKHFGWADLKARVSKYKRYQKLDPNCEFGWKEQYESILDENPNLTKWVE